MKINTVLGSLVLLLIVSYVLVSQISLDSHGDIARFIPADALCFIEQYQGVQVIKKFSQSPLGKKISSLDYKRLTNELGLDASYAGMVEEIRRTYHKLADDKLVDTLFARHVAIILAAPLSQPIKQESLETFVTDNLLLICEPKYNATLLTILGEEYAEHNSKYSIISAQYGNHSIKRLIISNTRVSLVSIDGFFLIALNERQLRKAIDAYDNDIKSIDAIKPFQKCVKHFHNAQRFFYCNIEQTKDTLESLLKQRAIPRKELLTSKLETIKGFDGIAYGNWKVNNNIFSEKVVTHFKSEEILPVVQKYLKVRPVKPKLYGYTTKDPMFYYWSNTINLKHILPYLQGEGESREQFQLLDQKIKKTSGKTVLELLDMVGTQASLHISAGDPASAFQVPRVMIFFAGAKTQDLATIASKVFAAFRIEIAKGNYSNVEYQYWPRGPEDGLQPVFGIFNGNFFIGNSSVLLKEIVDYHDNGRKLPTNPAVKKLDPGITQKNNSVTYLHNTKLLEFAQKVLNLLSTIVAIEDKTVAKRAKIIADQFFVPLLEGAKMYEHSMNRSYFTGETVVIESKTRMSAMKRQKEK